MGYVLPGWMDEILDFIGINWPNVDEDEYREMADAMREFADKFEGHGGDAHATVNRILSSSEGWAVDALQDHWNKVKASHLDEVPNLARLFATACDVVADIIFGMKTKAEIELGAMAASIGISIGLAFVTGGLSALIGAAETQAMRELIRRIIKEAEEEIVDRLLAEVTEPVTGKLEKMTEDMVLDIADDAISLPPSTGGAGGGGGDAGGGGHHGGKGGMSLDSVDGGGSSSGGGAGGGRGGGGTVHIDHEEYENGASKLSRHGSDMHTDSLGSLTRAKGAFGRTRGKDPFTQAFDSVLHGALNGSEKALKKVTKHITDNVPGGIRASSRNHRRNEEGIVNDLKSITSRSDAKGPSGAGGGPRAAGRNVPGSSNKPPSPDWSRKGRAAEHKSLGGDPIDMATGEVFQSQTDLSLPGILPLVIERTHISSYRHGHFFGASWASTLDERLELVDEGRELWWHRPDGSSLRYDHAPDLIGEEVQPVEGQRIPLTCVQGNSGWDLAVHNPHTGITRRFLPTSHTPAHEASVWWLTEIEDRNGNSITIDRSAGGEPTTILHSGGYHLSTVTQDGLLTELYLHGPKDRVRVCSYGYDADRNLTEVTNSSGLPLRFGYDSEHRLTAWTDRNESTFSYVFDEHGRVVRTIGPEGHLSSRLSYDTENQCTSYTDSTGATTTYHLNHLGQTVAETDPLGHTSYTEWDRYDRELARTDALGNTTRFEYDETGNVTTIEHPNNTHTLVRYNRLHFATEITLPDGAVWQQEFDTRGNRTAVVAPDGSPTRYTHASTGAVATTTDALGSTTTTTSNEAGLLIGVIDPLGAETTCNRDAFGRIKDLTDASGATTHLEWTVEGKPSRRVAPGGASETWTWDGEGNCLSHINPLGGQTRYTYTHFDLPASRTTPDGGTYTFSYDTELRLTQVTAPNDRVWQYTYNPVGQLISESDFDNRIVTYAHDAAGRMISRTTPQGDTITFELDGMGRMVSKDAAGAVTRYSYDSAGRLVTAAASDSSVVLERDELGRITSETVDGRTLRSTYDSVGRRVSRTTPSGAVSISAYDAAGNRTALTTDGHSTSFEHDPLGRELERSYGQAVTLATGWDEAGRLGSQTLSSGSRSLRARTYTYRPDSHLTAITDELTGTTRHLTLDPVGRPLQVTANGWSETYAYDQTGSQSEATWPEHAGDPAARGERQYAGTRIQSAGGVSYEYDAAGRTVVRRKKRLSRKPDVWRYEYDAEDRLTSCTTPDGAVWTYTYDPLGRRTGKHRIAHDGAGIAASVYFTWDGTRLAEQSDTASGVTTTWDHAGQRPLTQYERRPLTQEEVDSRFFAVITDLVGTPTELVDETGHIAWHARSTAWGTTAWNSDATAYTPLRYPGQYADPETGLHFNFFRHYDPDTARYTSPDPLGLAPAPNPVTYVHNPYTWTDMLGLAPYSDSNGRITVYRKQTDHPKSQRVQIGANGEVSITGKGKLYVNMSDDIRHTQEFRGDGGQIVAFDIPRDYRDKIRADALPQKLPSEYEHEYSKSDWRELLKVYPEISDPTKGTDLYGIPDSMLGELQHNIIPGSGRVVQEG